MSEMPPLEIRPKSELETCRAKVRYPTKKIARSMINYLRQGHLTHGRAADLRTYCCPVCQGWHLTKNTDSAKSSNRRALAIRLLMRRFEVRQRRELTAARHPLDDSLYQLDPV